MPERHEPRSEAVTRGVRVTVESRFIAEQSSEALGRFVFAYHIRIANEGKETLQLRTRHWIIADATGRTEEVRGPGVVGETPVLAPGEAFEYTSGAVLRTQRGSMRGTYQMHRADGSSFDAQIAPFLLERPYSLN
ncbi:MAG: Co2+/Mg2+ efflux protein ApaG [Myxococcales bacterium]|nr:Co2+/Mg2+ efflux protein ApaG [Myxococcales bacterium]